MIRMTPISLQADGADAYRVRCETSNGEVEYRFWIEKAGDIELLKDPEEFRQEAHEDHGGHKLRQAILAFHQSRKAPGVESDCAP